MLHHMIKLEEQPLAQQLLDQLQLRFTRCCYHVAFSEQDWWLSYQQILHIIIDHYAFLQFSWHLPQAPIRISLNNWWSHLTNILRCRNEQSTIQYSPGLVYQLTVIGHHREEEWSRQYCKWILNEVKLHNFWRILQMFVGSTMWNEGKVVCGKYRDWLQIWLTHHNVRHHLPHLHWPFSNIE